MFVTLDHCTVSDMYVISFVFSLYILLESAGIVRHDPVRPQAEGSLEVLLLIKYPEIDRDAPPVKMIEEDGGHQEPVDHPEHSKRDPGETNIPLC